jgi:hypothetical protein
LSCGGGRNTGDILCCQDKGRQPKQGKAAGMSALSTRTAA